MMAETKKIKQDWRCAQRCLGADGSLSVIMPAFNLAGVIEANVRRVLSLLRRSGLRFEIIVVDDGSRDGTGDAILAAAKEAPDCVLPLVLPENGGKGNALRRGFAQSCGSHILLLDADLDLTPERVAEFFAIMERDGSDIVIGSKRHPESRIDYPLLRRLASRIYYGIVRLLIGLPATDTQTGMKLFRREALGFAFDRMLVKRFAFDLEMLAVAYGHGYKVSEAPITMDFGDKMGALSFGSVKSVMTDTLAIFYRLRLIKYYQNVELSALADPPPRVSVIIACPGHSAYLAEALAGIATQTLPPCEVIILPDCEMCEALACASIPLRVIPTGGVRPAEKRNIGIEAATGDVVAFLDDDARPFPQWLAQACRHFSRGSVGAVGGPAVTPPEDGRMARLGGDVYASPLVSGSCRYRYVSERIRKTDDMPSCNLLVRTMLLRKIGMFNTRYWPGEDTILGLDIVQSGAEMVYDPFATVYHHRRPLFGPHLRQVGRYAKHRGFFVREFPQTSRRITYMIPSIFVLGILFGAVLSCFFAPFRVIYFLGVAFYLLITFIFSVHFNLCDWLIAWLGMVLTHIVYGVRFLEGLIFGRMPRSVADFDHGPLKK